MKKTLQECSEDLAEAWRVLVLALAHSFGINHVLDFLTKILKGEKK